jgi:hypothetical protein
MHKNISFNFSHGLGDVIHMATMLQLWKSRGYDIKVRTEENKKLVWKAAGIDTVTSGEYPDHEFGYSSGFWDINSDDMQHNKICFNMTNALMPEIGDVRSLWKEITKVKMSYKSILSIDSFKEAALFLKDMPRPIVCIHSIGNNFRSSKSLSTEFTFGLICKLIHNFKGSVISLDFDGREPIVGHARCKGIKPSWGHIGFDRLCTLYDMVDFMLGIDSGPFHSTNFTNVKCAGIFRHINPVRCCIPNPNATYLVPKKHHAVWSKKDPELWRFNEYDGDEPSVNHVFNFIMSNL